MIQCERMFDACLRNYSVAHMFWHPFCEWKSDFLCHWLNSLLFDMFIVLLLLSCRLVCACVRSCTLIVVAVVSIFSLCYKDIMGEFEWNCALIAYKIIRIIRRISEYQREHNEASRDIGKYIANPINAYLLTKRLTSDWSIVEQVMSHDVANG